METTDPIFEIVVTPTRDRAEADTLEDALYSAGHLMAEAAYGPVYVNSLYLRAAIYYDGVLLRDDLRPADVGFALASA